MVDDSRSQSPLSADGGHLQLNQIMQLSSHILCLLFNSVVKYLLHWFKVLLVVVQLLSAVQLFVTPWTEAHHASLSFTISWSLLRLMSIESVMPSNHLILCHPLLLLPSTFPSIRVFSNESALRITCPKYWSFSFSISPSNECSGLISFRTVVLTPAPQFKSINSSVLSFLYSPALTSIHDHWKNHRLD